MWTIELPDGRLLARRWATRDAAARYLASASKIRSGAVVEAPKS